MLFPIGCRRLQVVTLHHGIGGAQEHRRQRRDAASPLLGVAWIDHSVPQLTFQPPAYHVVRIEMYSLRTFIVYAKYTIY